MSGENVTATTAEEMSTRREAVAATKVNMKEVLDTKLASVLPVNAK